MIVNMPFLKTRRRTCIRRTSLCLLLFSCVFFLWFIGFVKPSPSQTIEFPLPVNDNVSVQLGAANFKSLFEFNGSSDITFETLPVFDLSELSNLIELGSLTAILPVTHDSLPGLEALLTTFLGRGPSLREVIVTCPEAIRSEIRRVLRNTVTTFGEHSHPDFSLRPWVGQLDQSVAVMRAASQVTTGWMLLLDEKQTDDFRILPISQLLLVILNQEKRFNQQTVLSQ